MTFRQGATPPPTGERGNVVIAAARQQAEVDLLWEDFTRFCALAINAH